MPCCVLVFDAVWCRPELISMGMAASTRSPPPLKCVQECCYET